MILLRLIFAILTIVFFWAFNRLRKLEKSGQVPYDILPDGSRAVGPEVPLTILSVLLLAILFLAFTFFPEVAMEMVGKK